MFVDVIVIEYANGFRFIRSNTTDFRIEHHIVDENPT